MAQKDKDTRLTPTESRLLANPRYGKILRSGGKVKFDDLDIADAQALGVGRGQAINIKPTTLAELGYGQVAQRGRRQIFIPNEDIEDTSNMQPIQSLADIVRGTSIKPKLSPTNEPIITSAGKGVKKTFQQRRPQVEIPVEEKNKSIIQILAELAKNISQVPAELTGWPSIMRTANEAQYYGQTGIESLLRLLQSGLSKPVGKQTQEQNILNALRQTTGGAPARETQGTITTIGNKRYMLDKSGRIVEVREAI